jgi:hypothetical protein
MVAPVKFPWSFRSVSIYNRDRVYFVAGHDESTGKELPVSYVFRWTGKWDSQPIPTIATDLCVTPFPELNVPVMGINGTIIRLVTGKFLEEIVDESQDGPQYIGDLRAIKTIGKHAYVVGMGRTAYRCDGVAKWTRIDQGLRCPEGDDSNAGLNSIDGFSETDIYTVGWDGEIWHYDSKSWRQIESPTNVALFRVVCGQDGKVYACGQMGTLICGNGNSWQLIEHDETSDDFWGMTWFKGQLYLATTDALYVLKDGILETIEIKSRKKLKFRDGENFYHLDANEEVLWSVGKKMALYTEDGINWIETPYK